MTRPGVQVGAHAGLIGGVPPGAIMLGSPAMSRQEVVRGVATLERLSKRPPG